MKNGIKNVYRLRYCRGMGKTLLRTIADDYMSYMAYEQLDFYIRAQGKIITCLLKRREKSIRYRFSL